MKCSKCGTEFEGKYCPECGARADETAASTPPPVQGQNINPQQQNMDPHHDDAPIHVYDKGRKGPDNKKKSFFSKWWWLMLIIIIVVIIAIVGLGGKHLSSPMEMETITWPTGTAGKQLPVPKSTTGKFSFENDDSFSVYIGETTKADYDEYVNACSDKGFSIDYSKDDRHYQADNAEGWHLTLVYEGNSIMSIGIDPPDKNASGSEKETEATSDAGETASVDKSDETKETSAQSEAAETKETSPESEDTETEEAGSQEGMRSDFKAAMDSYEDFMDEYVAFMKKYNENPSDAALLADYAKFMSEYADFVADFESWESEDLTADEWNYYLEVQDRVNQKLLEVAE